MNGARTIESRRRRLSLTVGLLYMVAGVVAGLNVDTIWTLYAPTTTADSMRRTLSALAVIFPHVLVTAGFALLIAGSRISGRSFVVVGLIPVVYVSICLIARALS